MRLSRDNIDFDTFAKNGCNRSVFKDFINAQVAIVFSQLSTAKRMKCGCVLQKNGFTISSGYNGTLKGQDNTCEDDDFNTKNALVVHAEQNCLADVDTNNDGYYVLYSTHLPCEECMKLCMLKKIDEIVYLSDYRRKNDYIEYAKKFIKIRKIETDIKLIYGIYIDDTLVYIGSSTDPLSRWDTHITYLHANKHINKKLQTTYNNSESKEVVITALKYCPFESVSDMRSYEYELIKRYKPTCNQQIDEESRQAVMSGINNKREEGNWWLGRKHTQETKQRISMSRKGKASGVNAYQYVDVDISKIYMLKKSGKSIKKIARELNTTERIINSRLKLMREQDYDI